MTEDDFTAAIHKLSERWTKMYFDRGTIFRKGAHTLIIVTYFVVL